MAFSNGKESLAWLDLLLQISGASSTLDKLISALEPSFAEIERKIHPAIQRLEKQEEQFRRMKESQSGRQRAEMAEKGYTFLDREQAKMLGMEGEEEQKQEMTREEMERMLEEDIRVIAEMDEGQITGSGEGGGGKSKSEREGRVGWHKVEKHEE